MRGVGQKDAQRLAFGEAVGFFEIAERFLRIAGQVFDDGQMVERESAGAGVLAQGPPPSSRGVASAAPVSPTALEAPPQRPCDVSAHNR